MFAPLFLIFEIWQLVLSERYLGIKQIARGADPRSLGLGEVTAFFWSTAIITYWTWMLLLLFVPGGRVHGLSLLAVSVTVVIAPFPSSRCTHLNHTWLSRDALGSQVLTACATRSRQSCG